MDFFSTLICICKKNKEQDVLPTRMPFYVMSQWKRLESAPKESLYPVLDSLNQLGEVPWVINQPILDLQIQIFR